MKDKQYLYDMYNATSTDDGKGEIETYENWLERQLISRIEKLNTMQANDAEKSKSNCNIPHVRKSFTLDDMRKAYDAAVFNPNEQTFNEWIKQAYNVC